MATPRPAVASPRRLASTSPQEPHHEPEMVIGEFQRGREIGKGSFATVFLAKHIKKRSYAAVKAVEMSKLTRKLKDNLETEVNILKSLQHPHIVALFTCTERPTYIYLVMEYCKLSDLAQFMKKRHDLAKFPETADIFKRYPNPQAGGLNEVLSRHFVKQMVSALEYLRGRNLIHRDIKPQNLLLNPAPSFMSRQRPEDVPLVASEQSLVPIVGVETLPMLKIADFGFARHLPSTSMAETLCGSPLYMAPEILRYEKYDARADLWSAGTVLYEMVVGKPPFRAQNHVELLRKIQKADDIIVFDNKNMVISRGMKELIRSLLKQSPVDRITYDHLFQHSVVTGPIPGLVPEDEPRTTTMRVTDIQVSEISRRMASQGVDNATQNRQSPNSELQPRLSQDEVQGRTPRKSIDREIQSYQSSDMIRRKSSTGTQIHPETHGREIPRQSGARQQQQRRPSIVNHPTAPGRQELHLGQVPSSAPNMERRASRSSPLANPPMVREPSNVDTERSKETRAARDARERTQQDIAFEKEYVVIEKRAVEVNAFADELDANANLRGSPQNQGAMVRRATTQGHPNSITGAQPASPSRGMQLITGRTPAAHQRAGSFERRYAPSPNSATTMLTTALKAANVRLFGALGTSPPFGKPPSPPYGYGAFPTYPAPQAALLLGDAHDTKPPMDEDSKIVRIMEDAAHRSDVIYGFAEVKYKQLVPAAPSAQDGLGIQQIGTPGSAADAFGEDEKNKEMTTAAIVGVAEEALVLYVKTLAILAKTIDLAGIWWNKQNRNEVAVSDASPKTSSTSVADVGKRMNMVVQWSRNRFNECLEKSEVVSRRLQISQRQLPLNHPGHPHSHSTASSSAGGAVTTSAEHIQITSGITAEKLMFERAVELSRAAAVSELVGEELEDCKLGYTTAIMLLEAVLEADDEPLMRKPSAKKDKPADEIVNGLETEDRQTVIRLVDGARNRLSTLRKKMYAVQQAGKRSSISGPTAPKPAGGPSPNAALTPTVAETPPR